jgi:hypothetical protein
MAMPSHPVGRRLPDSGALWFVVSVACTLAGVWLAMRTLRRYADPPPWGFELVLVGLGLLFVAGYAAWRLARAGAYSWLLPLAAFCLLLVEPGRAGDLRSWRLEWGVIGLAWTAAAVLVFARLLRRSDELERRLHLEGAFFGLVVGLVGSVVYALFESHLPELRGQWVAVVLLLSWWIGYLWTARRYRWQA